MATTEVDPPGAPPSLLPGLSALAWRRVQRIGTLLFLLGFLLFLGLHDHPELILLSLLLFGAFGATLLLYRDAMLREQAAGYTTLPTAEATLRLPGKPGWTTVRLFSTEELWQLDPRTGEVIRRPGTPAEPPPDAAEIERQDRQIESAALGFGAIVLVVAVVAVLALVVWAVALR